MKDYIEKLISRIHGDPENSFYIEAEISLGDSVRMASNVLDEWVAQDIVAPLLILGGYGIGKTSLCKQFALSCAYSWKDNKKPKVVPLLVPLLGVQKWGSIAACIEFWASSELGLSGRDWRRVIDNPGYVLILDGLDEMYTTSRSRKTSGIFREIRELSLTQCRLLLTARTHMFVRDDQIWGVPFFGPWMDGGHARPIRDIFQIAELREFSPEKIKKYLRIRLGDSESNIWHQRIENFGLGEIAQRPLLLKMLVESIQGGYFPKTKNISLRDLFAMYTQSIFEQRNKRTGVSVVALKRECIELARSLFEQKKERIRSRELVKLIDQIDPEVTPGDLPIMRVGSEASFSHMSIYDFFLCEATILDLQRRRLGCLRAGLLPIRTISFLAGWLRTHDVHLDEAWVRKVFERSLTNKVSRFQIFNLLRICDAGGFTSILAKLLEDALSSWRDPVLIRFALRLSGYCRSIRIHDQILGFMNDEDEGIRYLALEAAGLHKIEATSSSVILGVTSEKSHIKHISLWAMRKLRTRDMLPKAIEIISDGMTTDELRAGAQVAGMLRDPLAAPSIKKRMKESNLEEMAKAYLSSALSAIEDKSVAGDFSQVLLEVGVDKLLDAGGWKTLYMVELLGEELKVSYISRLFEIFKVSVPIIRDAVIDALGEFRSEKSTEFLQRAYDSEEEDHIRANIVWALSTSGDPRGLSLILRATADESEMVRKWAEWSRVRFVNFESPTPMTSQMQYPL